MIPSTEFSSVAKNMQGFLSSLNITPPSVQNNDVAPNATGLVNWSMTHRLDYDVDSRERSLFCDHRSSGQFHSGRTDNRWTRYRADPV